MVFMTQPVELSLSGSQDCGQLDHRAEQSQSVWLRSLERARLYQMWNWEMTSSPTTLLPRFTQGGFLGTWGSEKTALCEMYNVDN